MALRLPQLPPPLPYESHKRDHDDFLTTSSDPPMFSSDPPVFSTSIDDYQQPRRKRQYKGSCYRVEEEDANCVKKTRRSPRSRGTRHQRRPFRKFDSGVYMGSDESLPSELSDPLSEPGTCDTTTFSGVEAAVDNVETPESEHGQTQGLADSDAHNEDPLIDKATQTTEDPGDFAGPVFPYWQQQPERIRHFHIAQRIAQEKVLECVERGEEVVDLSNSYLSQIRTPTLRPLRFHIRQDLHPTRGRPAKYKRLTPSLTLFLSNNDLSAIPGELYHLRTLEVLSLRGNKIEELLPAINQLTGLKELNVASNQLPYLPFELLPLLQGSLTNITLYPNPFIRPTQPCSGEPFVPPARSVTEHDSSGRSHTFHHVASTWPSFLDITGTSMRAYPPPPSQYPSHRLQNPTDHAAHTARPPPALQQKTPSLLETALRNLSTAPELSQLPFHVPADEAPAVHTLLQRTYYLTESGGQKCTICGAGFVVPRTEWVEWWARDGGELVPFMRRGCSWACFLDTDRDKVDDDDDDGGGGGGGGGRSVERVGWRSGKEVELN